MEKASHWVLTKPVTRRGPPRCKLYEKVFKVMTIYDLGDVVL